MLNRVEALTHAVTGKRSYKEMVGADGSIKSVVRSSDKVIDASTLGPKEGKRMVVTGGHHTGLECIVRKLHVDGRQGAFDVNLAYLVFRKVK
jgi:hypothetical protein